LFVPEGIRKAAEKSWIGSALNVQKLSSGQVAMAGVVEGRPYNQPDFGSLAHCVEKA
jgi:hypothetical protein